MSLTSRVLDFFVGFCRATARPFEAMPDCESPENCDDQLEAPPLPPPNPLTSPWELHTEMPGILLILTTGHIFIPRNGKNYAESLAQIVNGINDGVSFIQMEDNVVFLSHVVGLKQFIPADLAKTVSSDSGDLATAANPYKEEQEEQAAEIDGVIAGSLAAERVEEEKLGLRGGGDHGGAGSEVEQLRTSLEKQEKRKVRYFRGGKEVQKPETD